MTDILALDIATTLGYARGIVGGIPTSGSIRFGKPKDSADVVFGQALEWITGQLIEPLPDFLIIEAMLPGGARIGDTSRATHDRLAGLHGIIRGVAHQRWVGRVEEASVLDVRQHFIGVRGLKRDVAKREVIRRCRALGWIANDDNAGDACALFSYACALIDPKTALRVSPLFNRSLHWDEMWGQPLTKTNPKLKTID